MKKKILAVLLSVALLAGSAAAMPEVFDEFSEPLRVSAETSGVWEYYVLGDGTVGITGYSGSDSVLSIPSLIDGKKVTSIGYDAFFYCTGITSITIPGSVTSIEDAAFDGCTGLTSITIPKNVTSLSNQAFVGCTNLSSINVESGNTKYSSYNGALYNKDKTELLYCPYAKKSITIPNSVKSIGDGAFAFCKGIKNVTIPSGVTSIGSNAFMDCESLTTVNIPNSVKSIGGTAFDGCVSLKSITLPSSVSSIGWGAFRACFELTKIDVNSANKTFSSSDGVLYNKNKTKLLCCPARKTSISIPNSVTAIEEIAFYACTNLTNITIPNSVTSIGKAAFITCSGLESISLSDKLTSITFDTFSDCSSLTSVTIPDSVKNIDVFAFGFCTNLTDIIIPSGVTSIADNAFQGCEKAKIITYKGSYAVKFAKENGIPYEIIQPGISTCKATIPYASYTYRGRGIKPSVTVKNSAGIKLTKDKDYTVSYSNNTKAGTATITVTGKGYYTGTLKKTFTVKPLDLSTSYAKVTIPYSAYTYSGSAIKPKVTVKFKDGDVIPTSDYTLTYSNNIKVGTATITIKGRGSNVTGTYKKTFVVKPAKNEITSITSTKGAFRISWKRGTAGTVGYQVQYSTDKTFVNNVHSYTSTDLSDLSENFSKVPNSGETWYVKVRSFYTKDGKTTSTRYGNYSAVKSIKVK